MKNVNYERNTKERGARVGHTQLKKGFVARSDPSKIYSDPQKTERPHLPGADG